MDGWRALTRALIWMIRNHIRHIRNESRLKIVFILSFAVCFWLGALGLFYKGFSFIHRFPLVGSILVDEAIYLFFAGLLIMLSLSSLIICYVTFYTSKEVGFLFSLPVGERAIFFYRFSQSVVFSSWAFLFIGIPFILAYALVKQVPFWFYASIPLYFIPYIILPNACASVMIIIFVKVIDPRRGKYLFGLLLFSILSVGYWAYRNTIRPAILAKTEFEYIMNELLHHLQFLRHPLFPGYWISRSIIASGINKIQDALFYFAAFLITTIFLLQINWILGKREYFREWAVSQEGGRVGMHPADRGILNRLNLLFSWLPREARAMTIKDIKIFLREPGQWSQFLIYFSILGLYIFNLKNIPSEAIGPFWQISITFLNLMATLLVLASLTVRFLFPLMSLEGNKLWILGLSPITFKALIYQKVILYFIGIFVISESLMFSTNVILHTSRTLTSISCGVAGLASFGLVGLSIGLGALYPNFKEENTAKIVSGFGGTLNFLISLVYVCLLIGAFALPFYSYDVYSAISFKGFNLLMAAAWGIGLSGTIAVGVIPVIVGYKHLEHTEV